MTPLSKHRTTARRSYPSIFLLFAAVGLLFVPPRLDAQAVFNQSTACGTQSVPTQVYTDLGTEVMAADDFVVPGGQAWSLDRVAIFGALAQTQGPTPTFNVTIYNDGANTPATLACTYSGLSWSTITVAPGIDAGFKFDLPSTCDLGSGTYWLEVQAVMPTTNGVFFWESNTAANGNPYVWQDPTNQFGTGCTTWAPHTSCLGIGGPDPDLCMALFEQGAVLDLAGPGITVDLQPPHLDVLQAGQLTATASEIATGGANVVDIEFQLDGGSWVPMQPGDGAYDSITETGLETISFAADGVHQACLRGTDAFANPSQIVCIDIGVGAAGDITGPMIGIGFAPVPIGTFEDGALTATANETNTGGANIAEIEFQLDGGVWMPMESLDAAYDSILETGIETVSFATIGTHQACVRGTDSRANVGDELCMDIEVEAGDSTPPPPPTVDVQPNPVPSGETATLSVTASDAATGNSKIVIIDYRVDAGNWTSIIPPLDGFYDESTEEAEVELSFEFSGTHSVCARATDGANYTGDPACVDVDVEATLRLRAIEVNQVIQNWRNEVPLYQNKDTVVRLFFEKTTGSSPNFANGLLHGLRGGQPLPGSPLATGTRANAGDDATAFELVDGNDADSDPDDAIESYRADLGNSLNFFLPSNWIDQGGTVDLEFELTSPASGLLECAEPDGNPDCKVGATFETSEVPIIELFSVPYNRNELRQLTVNATGGSYRFTVGSNESFEIPFDSGGGVIERAVEDVKGAKDNRVVVVGGSCPGGTPLPGNNFWITILRGQSEILDIDDSGLTGSATLTPCETGGASIAPGDKQLREQVRRMRDQLPTSHVDFRFRSVSGFHQAPTLFKVNQRLSKARMIDAGLGGGINKLKSIGFLYERGPTSTGFGLAWTVTAAAYLNFVEEPESGGIRRNTGVHEVAHTFGRAHAVFQDKGPLGSIGLCGSKFNDLASPFHPFIEDTGIFNSAANELDSALRTTWPTIGPLDQGPNDEVWGFSPRAFANGPGFEHLAVVDPRHSAELMSYCDPPSNRQDRWISTFSYDKLDGRLRPADSVTSESSQGLVSEDLFLVAGAFNEDTNEYELEPAMRFTGVDPGFEPGNVHIALLNSAGAEIASRDVLLLLDGNHPGLSDGPAPDPAAFIAVIPVPAGQDPAVVAVSLDAQEIARATASANPPTVQITSPTGATVASGTIPIVWNATDLDGDTLFTTIGLSTDLGTTWKTIGVDVEGSSYDAPTSFLEGSGSAMIKLLVSDGFHTTEATSQAFTLDAGYPSASIETPVYGIKLETDEILHLRGDAWDPEDGMLEGLSLAWSAESDAPGAGSTPLGSGEALDIPASQFTAGCHSITLTATDSDAKTSTDTVEVDIGATGCLGLIFADGFE